MNNEQAEPRFPAVERLHDELRVNLLRAVRAHPHARWSLSRRQRVGVFAVIGLLAVPGGIAAAQLLDSPAVDYQCPRAAPPPDAEVRAGVPVGSVTRPAEEPGTLPTNPCG
jgi:hypothetical protein